MHRLAILSRDADAYRDYLLACNLSGLDIVYAADRVTETERWASQVDILLADPELAATALTHCPNVSWVQSTWAGNTPLINAPFRDYRLTGVKGVFGPAMREYVFAYLLYFSRNIEGFRQQQQLREWQAPTFSALAGKRLGIMGIGSIGKEIVKAARLFGMTVRGLTRRSTAHEGVEHCFHPAQKLEFAGDLDYLLCLLPDTQDTRAIIDQPMLDALPSHCVLINAGRGNTIDDGALLHALDNKGLKAAVLDVFTEEPLPQDHRFWHHPRVWVTHHTAAVSLPETISNLFVDNFQRQQQGLPLLHQIDFDRGY